LLPCILAKGDWPKWLGEESATEQELLAMLKPYADDALKIWAVDNAVGNVKNRANI
jgi:putative SOS response-associated peptidase YedK